MRDTGGKSGRRPGRHLQVEASGPGNARPAHWRLAGRFRRGEVAEGCAGGAAGRSKGLICLRGAWMEDTGGKSARRPGRHLQAEASGPGNAASVQQRLAGRFRRGEVVEGCACGAEGRSKRLICLRGTWMEDTGGKSGRRPGRHLQVEASGPGNAASVPVCSGGLRVDSGESLRRKVAARGQAAKSMRRSSPRDLDGRYRR